MLDPSYVLLYVDSPARSAAFYQGLLGRPPVESSPGFAMFALESGVKLGLWARRDVEPQAGAGAPAGAELCIRVGDDDAVDTLHAEWRGRGVPIAQPPTRMDFGHTFVGLDPDGHRLRVFSPSEG